MVEVWLPYGDTEVPIMLPDPINLKIMPKTIHPTRREQDAISKLRALVAKRKPLNVFINPIADESEKGYILGVLRRLQIDYEIVDDIEKSNVVVDIFRYDPILGFRSSLWVDKLVDDPLNFLKEAIYRSEEPEISGDDRLYIDLILDGGARLFDVFGSRDGSHFSEAKNTYMDGWCLRSSAEQLIISSMGGLPWDSSIYLFMIGASKLAEFTPRDAIAIIISRVRMRTMDPTVLKDLTIDNAGDYVQLYIAYCRDKISNLNIVHYGSIPRSLASLLNISKTLNVERYLSRIPITRKRDVLVVEDLYLLHPTICPKSQEEEEA